MKYLIERIMRTGMRWSMVAQFMKLNISQVAALITLFGHGIIWNEDLRRFLGLCSHSCGAGDLKLHLMYFGAWFLAIAWVFYIWKCPSSVQRISSAEGYQLERLSAGDYFELEAIKTVLGGLSKRHRLPHLVETNINNAVLAKIVSDSTGDKGYHSTLYRAYYLYMEQKDPEWLVSCALLTGAGMCLLSLPALETLAMVLSNFIW
jgi:hypothetical protein